MLETPNCHRLKIGLTQKEVNMLQYTHAVPHTYIFKLNQAKACLLDDYFHMQYSPNEPLSYR